MNSFDININYKGEDITLNIHPEEAGSYQVLFHGAMVGELFMGDAENWEAVSANDPESSDYPLYEYDETSGHADMLNDERLVQQIGRAIFEAGKK